MKSQSVRMHCKECGKPRWGAMISEFVFYAHSCKHTTDTVTLPPPKLPRCKVALVRRLSALYLLRFPYLTPKGRVHA